MSKYHMCVLPLQLLQYVAVLNQDLWLCYTLILMKITQQTTLVS